MSGPLPQPWSVPITVTEVHESGVHVDLVADPPTREAVAKFVGVLEVVHLEAHFDLLRVGSDDLRVAGNVRATVVQACVVTLDPVRNDIDEPISLIFAPPGSTPDANPATSMQSVDIEDSLEELREGSVDLGAIATEFLLLGIDPYPRKPGVAFDSPAEGDPSAHPFAALAALKKGDGGKDS